MDEDWVFPALALVLIQFALGMAIAVTFEFAPRPNILGYVAVASVALSFVSCIWLLYVLSKMVANNEASPIRRLFFLISENRWKIGIFALGFQLVALQWAALGWLKQMIPLVSPFWADPMLASLDRTIFRQDAWRWLHPALNPVGSLIDYSYAAWFPVKAVVMGAVLGRVASPLKTQCMLAFFLTTGVFGALGQFLLSSAGPIFYARLGLGDDFAMLPILPAAGLAADYLWQGYTQNAADIGRGISAMPSLHVANAAWVALVVTALWRPLAILGWVFFVIISIGSVYLGWHYAIDAIAGLLIALVAWAFAKMSSAKLSSVSLARGPRASLTS